MSNPDREKQAREAARRAQEEEIRRRRIQAQIDELEKEKMSVSKSLQALILQKVKLLPQPKTLQAVHFIIHICRQQHSVEFLQMRLHRV